MPLNTLAKLLILLLFNTLFYTLRQLEYILYLYFIVVLTLITFFLKWLSQDFITLFDYFNHTKWITNSIGSSFNWYTLFVVLGIISVSIRIMPGFLMFYFYKKY